IAKLEAETGAKLMERAGRGVRLPDVGRLLAQRAEEILGRRDAAEAELAVHIGLRHDRVRLAAFGSALSTLVAAAGAALRLERAGSAIHLTEADPTQAMRMLRAGEADVALIFRYLRDGSESDSLSPVAERRNPPAGEETGGRLLLDEPMYLISRDEVVIPRSEQVAGHAVTDSEVRSAILTARASERWIGAGEQCTDVLADLCHCAGFSPDMALRSAGFVAAQALVAAGLGVAIPPGLALQAPRPPGIRATGLPRARPQSPA